MTAIKDYGVDEWNVLELNTTDVAWMVSGAQISVNDGHGRGVINLRVLDVIDGTHIAVCVDDTGEQKP